MRGVTFGAAHSGYHEVNAKYIQTNPRNHCPELILPNGKCRQKTGIEDRQTCQATVLKHLKFRSSLFSIYMNRFQFKCNVGYAAISPEPICSCFIKIHSIISLPRSKCIWDNVPEKG